ncbi:hypothetical protein [Jiangella gansuensis]|uniref:hypothetical protein n=1 Tax=Jiangella gansuensis TaxID=281473 RepID=UPI0012F90B7D|nr:hypothetical protein [Jiangella gansuensis]
MGVYGDYAASIIHEQRSRELQAQVRQDRLARSGREDGRRSEERKARARAGARPRTV